MSRRHEEDTAVAKACHLGPRYIFFLFLSCFLTLTNIVFLFRALSCPDENSLLVGSCD